MRVGREWDLGATLGEEAVDSVQRARFSKAKIAGGYGLKGVYV